MHITYHSLINQYNESGDCDQSYLTFRRFRTSLKAPFCSSVVCNRTHHCTTCRKPSPWECWSASWPPYPQPTWFALTGKPKFSDSRPTARLYKNSIRKGSSGLNAVERKARYAKAMTAYEQDHTEGYVRRFRETCGKMERLVEAVNLLYSV